MTPAFSRSVAVGPLAAAVRRPARAANSALGCTAYQWCYWMLKMCHVRPVLAVPHRLASSAKMARAAARIAQRVSSRTPTLNAARCACVVCSSLDSVSRSLLADVPQWTNLNRCWPTVLLEVRGGLVCCDRDQLQTMRGGERLLLSCRAFLSCSLLVLSCRVHSQGPLAHQPARNATRRL